MALHGIIKDAWSRFNDKGYKHYDVKYAGYKYNMIDLLETSLGIHQLKNIDKRWLKRKKIWQKYNEAFQSLPFQTPIENNDKIKHSYHLYTIFLDLKKINISRDQFIAEMHNQNIGVGVHISLLHLQPYYKNKYGYKFGDFINAEKISKITVSLPLSSKLTQSEQNHIIESVRMILDKHSK